MRRLRRSGFTLIEVAIVLTILMIASFPAMEMFDQIRRQYQRAVTISALKNDCADLVARIDAAAGNAPFRIDRDQRGASFPNGKLYWDGQSLELTRDDRSKTVLHGVRHASLFRRGGRTFLTLEVASGGARPYTYRTFRKIGSIAR